MEPATEIHQYSLPTDVTLSERDLCDLEMLLMGAFAPLSGYLSYADFCSCVEKSRLVNRAVWPIPIVLPVAYDEEKATEIAPPVKGKVIKLRDIFGTVLAEVDVDSCYKPNLEVVCENVLGTTEMSHPYVKYLHEEHSDVVYIGGAVREIHPILHFDFRDLRRPANAVREALKAKNWECIVGFQTRNPMHRSHFELTVQALKEAEETTGKKAHLLLTPACGPTQPGDISYPVRVRCYKKLLPFYADLGHNDAGLVLLPLAMRMAGPREALWHALIRKNYGCTHFIVGRDHAGPSTRKKDGSPFYGPYEAHTLLQQFQNEIGIVPIFGKNMLFLGEEQGYVQQDKVPTGVQGLSISGTRFREMLENREEVPSWYSFKPVVDVLQSFYKKRSNQGFCVYFTGLPCSGKSTLACAVQAAIRERETELRQITLLDADIIRTHLSRGLGFSREDRQCNVRRIGYVASVVVHHGGICLVANIAPYEEDRQANRAAIAGAGGGYIEVHVSTPLDVCENRDVKGLYRKAREGIIKQFTGISDPYEIPQNPELVVNSSEDIDGSVQKVMHYLETKGWILPSTA